MGLVLLCVTYWMLLNQVDLSSTEDVISDRLEFQQRNIVSYFLNGALEKVFSVLGTTGLKWLKNFASQFQSIDSIIQLISPILKLPQIQSLISKIPGLAMNLVLAGSQSLADVSVILKKHFMEYSYLQGVADGDFLTTFVRFYKIPQVAKFVKKQIQSPYFQNLLKSFKEYTGATKEFFGNMVGNANQTQLPANSIGSNSAIGSSLVKKPVTKNTVRK